MLFHLVDRSCYQCTILSSDPRAPYQRKEIFVFGRPSFGLTSNTLALGYDYLGYISYIEDFRVIGEAESVRTPKVRKHSHFAEGDSVKERPTVIPHNVQNMTISNGPIQLKRPLLPQKFVCSRCPMKDFQIKRYSGT